MERHILATPIGGIELWTENGRLSALNLTGATPSGKPLDGPLVKELERYFAGEPVKFDGFRSISRAAQTLRGSSTTQPG